MQSCSTRLPGVSFVLRARNEDRYIADALASLETLMIPFEVIVILHRCTDNTRSILSNFSYLPIKVITSEQMLSRAGFETLITPADDPHSLVNFYNMCFSQAKMKFMMKFDADFRLSEDLLNFFNFKLDFQSDKPVCYQIPCRLSRTVVNTEIYLFNSLLGYTKSCFWEYPKFDSLSSTIRLQEEILSIPPNVLKTYWKQAPWWEVEQNEEFRSKYKQLVNIVGTEPVGMARASNVECDQPFNKVRNCQHQLASIGIFLYK